MEMIQKYNFNDNSTDETKFNIQMFSVGKRKMLKLQSDFSRHVHFADTPFCHQTAVQLKSQYMYITKSRLLYFF